MEKIGHLYKITRKLTGEYYYGIHRGDKFDGYWGSGRIIKNYIKTHGTADPIYEVLAIGQYDEMIKLEEKVVTDEEIKNPLCWNLKTGGYRGLPSAESRLLISISGTGQRYSPERTEKIQKSRRVKIGEIGQKISKSNRGKKRSDDVRKRISDRKKELMSLESRKRISLAKQGSSNPAWRGYVKTPDGIFESSMVAALYYKKTDATVRNRIKSSNSLFEQWMFVESVDDDEKIITRADIEG